MASPRLRRNPVVAPAAGAAAAPARRAAWLAPALLLALAIGCGGPQKTYNPGAPVVAGAQAAPPAQRPPRPTPPPEKQLALAAGDVVAAGEAYVRALYAADDLTAMQYQPGFGLKLREHEDNYELLNLSARPMTWGEAGYADADPTLEFAEIVARVQSRKGAESGNVYYKLGFKRLPEGLSIDLASRRLDVR